MQIQNNMAAVNSSRNQRITKNKLNKTLEKLSSGYRINRAGDDAAGLAISELMRNQIRGLDQAMANVNDGVSMTNTGEGALQEIHSMLQRMKTLAVQAANGTYSSVARENIEAERLELLSEIDRVSQTTDFDDIPLFGEYPQETVPPGFVPPEKQDDITLQIGHSDKETLDVERYFMGSTELLLDQISFSTVKDANKAVDTIEEAIEAVADVRASFGASLNHLEHTNNNLGVTKENVTTAESRIRDTDMADQITAYTADNILLQASNSVMAHANSLPDLVLQLLQI
ncbi:flagellin [Hungatella sp.]|uniref:flagellin N-terminal helical domain-containing protein n=1 Tax=Hungatella sp. TaxID=2613924 RepID=UPI002A83F623|nr:flagellin [Hungatella sp.]